MGEFVLKPVEAGVQLTLSFAAAVMAVTGVTVTPRGLVPGAAKVVAATAIAAGAVQLTLTGGTDGERYDVAIAVTLTGGAPATRDLDVAAIAADWAMPDGSTGWLSVTEFVERYGIDETIDVTAQAANGAYDRVFLIGALRDAQAEVEANIAAKYALPLTIVPAIVKTAVADLARLRLHPRGAPDAVAEAAKAQRRTLERIASGALPLPLPAGAALDASDSAAPVSYHSGGRTYGDGLADY